MLKKSNLYVERIFSEHPLGAWSLDDDIAFRQILSSAQQNAADADEWTASGISPASRINNSNPIAVSPVSSFSKGAGAASLTSSFSIDSTDLSSDKSDVCFSIYVYDESRMTYEISSGSNTYSISPTYTGWHLLSLTFEPVGSFSIALSITGPSGTFMVSGLSVGQWSERYNSFSVGFNEVSLPADVSNSIGNPGAFYGVPLDSYGIYDDSNGYYLISENKSFVKPGGIPMAFGSSQTLTVYPAPYSNPSFLFPGFGFLNVAGQHNNYTLEAWVRVYNSSIDPIRIIGPVASTDGIYLEEGFVSIYVGEYTKSYFVGKFDRPMLLSFQYSEERVALLINGEQVISMEIDIDNIDFPTKESNGYSQDWIGVYGSEYVSPFEIDCIAIFPYLVPPEISKRHFVFGQGVQDFEFSNREFLKKTVQIDFPYSEYAYNVIYPDSSRWRTGFSVNMDTTSSNLSATKHRLPEIIITGDTDATEQNWFSENRTINTSSPDFFPYITMLPTESFSNVSIYFENLSLISDKVEAVAGVFRSPTAGSNCLIMKFDNKVNNDAISIHVEDGTLLYEYHNSDGINETVLYTEPLADNAYFNAGFDISMVTASFFPIIGNFFANPNNISLSIGGSRSNDGQNFAGRFYGIHFNNKYFLNKDWSGMFDGIFVSQDTGVPDLIKYIGNYSLLPIFKNVTMGFDIGAAGYWEDVIPLSMFGKTISASAGAGYYDLDMIQFNIDTPYRQDNNTSPPSNLYYWTMKAYLTAEDKTYGDIDALGYTDYQSVVDDFNANASDLRYSTSFNSYITLQHYTIAGNQLYSHFSDIVSASANRVVSLSASPTTNKYEIFDNHIILIPDDIDFQEYYLGIHLEMKIRGTIEKNMALKRMELASFTFNDGLPTRIGTKYSIPIYPLPIGGP